MSSARGKRLACSTAAVALAVLVAAGIACKDRILEEWRLHVLKVGDQEARCEAAWRLGEMASIRALPRLVERIQDANCNPSLKNTAIAAIHKMGVSAVPTIAKELGAEPVPWKRLRSLLARQPTSTAGEPCLRFYTLSNAMPPFKGIGNTTGVGVTAEDDRREGYLCAVTESLVAELPEDLVETQETDGAGFAMFLGGHLAVRAPEEIQGEIAEAISRFEGNFPFHVIFDPERLDASDVPMLLALWRNEAVSRFWRDCIRYGIESMRQRIGAPVKPALETASAGEDHGIRQAAAEALR